MAAFSTSPPYPVFPDVDGQPVEDGFIYIGTAGLNPEASPITAYWDAALTIPAAQPVRTLGGFPSNSGTPGRLYVNADDYSILVRNKNGSLIYSSLNATDRIPASIITGLVFKSVDNYTTLRSNFVAGLYVAGDVVTVTDPYIAGQFVVEAGSTDDGGTYISDGGALTARRIYTGPLNVQWFGAEPDTGTDQSAAFNAALATQESVFVPDGRYSLSAPVQIKYDGQALFGAGTYNTELEWIGTSGLLNMVELWSGRRDMGNNSLAVTNQRLENFKISTKTGSDIQNLIWVEAGCIHGWVQKIRGFDIRGGIPTEAIMKLDSNGGQSYALGMNFRDIVLTGGANDDLAPVPIGIWIESAIECLFESVKVYTTQIGWQLGTNVTANIRNVVDCTFVHCQSEIGDRGYADGNGRAMVFYQGRHLNFISCKFMAGADFGATTTQLPLRFSGDDSFQNKAITFDGCTIWGVENCVNAMNFDSNVNYQGVKFKSCEFYGYQGALMTLTGDDVPYLFFDDDCTYVLCEATVNNFDIESIAETSFTVNNASGITQSLHSGNDTTQMLREEAILVAYNDDTQGVLFSAYKSTPEQVQVRGYNRSGSNVTVADGYWYNRGIGRHNSRLQGYASYDPPSLAGGASASTTVNVAGARLGDFVCVSFDQDCQDVNTFAYVSADDVVTVYFVNRTSSVRDLDAGTIRVYVLGEIITSSGKATYGPPSLAANSGVTTTVTAPGAQLGDIAVFSFGLDLQGIIGYAWVSAANTVSVRLQNESGGVLDLAISYLRVGVIETPQSI